LYPNDKNETTINRYFCGGSLSVGCMSKQLYVEIKGARVNNLKNVDVRIAHGKFTVITGLSGSGKSSLAFDTLYAEGQRRYIESLSSYARQFLGKLDKPEVDYIKGVAPAIAIQQKVISNNPRSTVGTTTEIYDYLKLLFARIGKTYSPISGQQVKHHTVTDVVQFIERLPIDERLLILCPLPLVDSIEIAQQLKALSQQGFVRIFLDETIGEITDFIREQPANIATAQLIIDRATANTSTQEALGRLADSVQLAFSEGNGECSIYRMSDRTFHRFSTRFELDGMEFQQPSEHFFSFNNPLGACKQCKGLGQIIGIDPNLVIPDQTLSVYQGAIVAWRGESMGEYLQRLIDTASRFDFPIHRPINQLTEKQYQLLWNGNEYFVGLHDFFQHLESKSYKMNYRIILSRFRGATQCPSCEGTRLRKDAHYVKIHRKSIADLTVAPIHEVLTFFQQADWQKHDRQIAQRIIPEIINRLSFLQNVGLDYLTLHRASNTLSGGESQRINLASSLSSSLVGSMYILDEPSIGLHPRDTQRLIGILHRLRNLGNTVIVVEHEEDIMRAADEVIDMGPMAGTFGGEVVFHGQHSKLVHAQSITAEYLSGKRQIAVPSIRNLQFEHIHKHNIHNLSVAIPLNNLVCITGVSGSGKSTLVKEIIYPAVQQKLGKVSLAHAPFQLSGDWKTLQAVELIDQNPIGKSTRSNPVTYVKAFDDIRELFAQQPLAKARNYKAGFFSFNTDGGRCEVCQGEGQIVVEMQFMADIHLTCQACKGTRYKNETLEIDYRGKNIADILEMDIETARTFFQNTSNAYERKIAQKIQPLYEVGLGYLKLGQASSTMSGGEAQRIKLASFLSKGSKIPSTLFIFDEPTTGLHFYDIDKLLVAFNKLVDAGHSIIVIEHNSEVIKCADWIVDLGPEGGMQGGKIVFEGTPEDLIKNKDSYTGKYLKMNMIPNAN